MKTHIDIYSNYKVENFRDYAYKNEEADWCHESRGTVETIDGSQLAKHISDMLNNEYFSEVDFEENYIIASTFDLNTGETTTEAIRWEEINE